MKNISFYVAECGEFHTLGRHWHNMDLVTALHRYKNMKARELCPTLGLEIHKEGLHKDGVVDILVNGRMFYSIVMDIIDTFDDEELIAECKEAVERICKLVPQLDIIGKKTPCDLWNEYAENLVSKDYVEFAEKVLDRGGAYNYIAINDKNGDFCILDIGNLDKILVVEDEKVIALKDDDENCYKNSHAVAFLREVSDWDEIRTSLLLERFLRLYYKEDNK